MCLVKKCCCCIPLSAGYNILGVLTCLYVIFAILIVALGSPVGWEYVGLFGITVTLFILSKCCKGASISYIKGFVYTFLVLSLTTSIICSQSLARTN